MEYLTDSSENQFLQIPLGWDAPEIQLRITFVEKNYSIRLNRTDGDNHVFPGPEFDYQHIPRLIEALAKIYNDKKNKNAT